MYCMEFSDYIENRYEDYKQRIASNQSEKHNFADWWRTFIHEGKEHSGYWKDFMKDGKGKESFDIFVNEVNSRQTNKDLLYLAYLVAKYFYPNEVNTVTENGKREITFNQEGPFKSSNGYGMYMKALKKIMGGKGLNITDSKKNNAQFYWIDVLSALQGEFALFDSLKMLNEFIRKIYLPTIEKQEDNVALKSFGLYIRRIEHLCFAYTIFKGENCELAKELIEKLSDTNKPETKSNLTEEIRADIDNRITCKKMDEFEKFKSLSKESFIEKIEKNYNSFCFIKASFHTTIVTAILKILGKDGTDVENRIDTSICYEEVLGQNYDVEITQTDELKANLKKKIVPPRILPDPKEVSDDKVCPFAVELTDKNSLYLRRLLILALMKTDFDRTDKKYFYKDYHNSAYDFIFEGINGELKELGLSEIEVSQNYNDNTLNNKNVDLFDWFVTECILYDEKEQKQEGSAKQLYVTGFKQFKNYMKRVFTFDE